MARYIDADMLLADILDERIVNKSENAQIALRHFERMVNRTPTADVAPRAEVAREICCKIEEEIVAALESNYKAKAERMANPRIDADEFISYCEGKNAALRGIEAFVEELKKKYTA